MIFKDRISHEVNKGGDGPGIEDLYGGVVALPTLFLKGGVE
jgi:hypothetical protein